MRRLISSQPSLTIGYVVAQILLFPIGKACEKLPEMRIGTERFGFRLNPGKFTIKEHALIVIVSGGQNGGFEDLTAQ